MRINPIAPSPPVQPVGRMHVTHIVLPVAVTEYKPQEAPAPDWLIALGMVSLVILMVTALVLWA